MAFADLSHIRPFKIGDTTYTATMLMQAVGVVGTLAQDLAECSSWIAYWGARTAEAKKAVDDHQVEYRVERDKWAAKRRAEGKITKDALDEEWRARPEYPGWYAKTNELEYAWNCANFMYEACRSKSMSLSSIAKLHADEAASRASAAKHT